MRAIKAVAMAFGFVALIIATVVSPFIIDAWFGQAGLLVYSGVVLVATTIYIARIFYKTSAP